MLCPKCRSPKGQVVDSRLTQEGAVVRRRRTCLKCGHRFTTYEEVSVENFFVLKKDGRREPFAREKLCQGIRRACAKRPVTEERIGRIVDAVVGELEALHLAEIPSRTVGDRLLARLREEDQVAAVRFASVFRRFAQPDDFIAEATALCAANP